MRIVRLQNEDVNVKDSWKDLTTAEYISLMELYSESADMVAELFLVRFITILTGKSVDFISSLYEEELMDFPDVIAGFKLDEFADIEQKSFTLEGKLYSYNLPNQLTLGEKISIKLLEKNSKTQYEQWLNLLAILVRPATEKVDEFGGVQYELEPFVGDMNILNRRKELFKQIPGINSMFIVKAFTNGRLK